MFVKISVGIFLALVLSRFLPHPPNFTSLIALSFYIPALFGIKFLPILIISYIFTDFIIGFHEVALFTWGSVLLIALMSKFFLTNMMTRISGALLGASLFYLLTNFVVWSLGTYGYSFEGLILNYTLALPFFANNIISTLFFSLIIEIILNRKNFLKKYLINLVD